MAETDTGEKWVLNPLGAKVGMGNDELLVDPDVFAASLEDVLPTKGGPPFHHVGVEFHRFPVWRILYGMPPMVQRNLLLIKGIEASLKKWITSTNLMHKFKGKLDPGRILAANMSDAEFREMRNAFVTGFNDSLKSYIKAYYEKKRVFDTINYHQLQRYIEQNPDNAGNSQEPENPENPESES
jgi:hypothetical protein